MIGREKRLQVRSYEGHFYLKSCTYLCITISAQIADTCLKESREWIIKKKKKYIYICSKAVLHDSKDGFCNQTNLGLKSQCHNSVTDIRVLKESRGLGAGSETKIRALPLAGD